MSRDCRRRAASDASSTLTELSEPTDPMETRMDIYYEPRCRLRLTIRSRSNRARCLFELDGSTAPPIVPRVHERVSHQTQSAVALSTAGQKVACDTTLVAVGWCVASLFVFVICIAICLNEPLVPDPDANELSQSGSWGKALLFVLSIHLSDQAFVVSQTEDCLSTQYFGVPLCVRCSRRESNPAEEDDDGCRFASRRQLFVSDKHVKRTRVVDDWSEPSFKFPDFDGPIEPHTLRRVQVHSSLTFVLCHH